MKLDLLKDGAELFEQAVLAAEYHKVLDVLPKHQAGIRLMDLDGLADLVGEQSLPCRIAKTFAGAQAQPVRVVYFDKTVSNNWRLGWHQDRTIAVAEKVSVRGFKNWTVKNHVQHVEPPFPLLSTHDNFENPSGRCG